MEAVFSKNTIFVCKNATLVVTDSKCDSSDAVPVWVLGIPWLIGGAIIFSSVVALRRLPEHMPNADGVDFVEDSATVTVERRRAQTTTLALQPSTMDFNSASQRGKRSASVL